MTDNDQALAGWRRALGALAPEAWMGRQATLDRLYRRLRQHPRREPQALALLGPEGAGKSELLRQAALAWSRPDAELTPLFIDLSRLSERFETRQGSPLSVADPRAWNALLRDLLAQLLVAAGRLGPEFLGRADAGAALDAHLPAMEPWARGLDEWLAWPERAGAEAYEDFLNASTRLALSRPLVLIDGLATLEGAMARAWLRPLAQGARRAGCALLVEAPAEETPATQARALGDLEAVALEPLSPAAATGLAQALAAARGAALEPADAWAACERLGRWPGWLRAWIGQMPMEPVGMAPRRLAEQAYVDLLDASPWSRRLAARLEAALPFAAREGALALALRAASEPSPMDAAHVLQCLAVPPEAAEQAVAALAALGLVEPAGTRLRGPQWRALADWAWLRLEQGRQGGDPAAPRLALLARLMTESSDPETASAPGAAGSARRLLTEILARLAGQELPEALFHYHDFYEAVGRLDPPRRREAMLRATRRLRAPESLGVATGMAGEPWPLFHARVFRDGLYRAANEELWVAVDLSATRSLTTAEIQQALQIAKNEGRRLGAVACHPWLIVGQAASADAMEMLRREDIDCSNLEQLALLHDLLVEPAARRAPGAMEAPEDCQAPMSCPAPPSEPDAGHPGAVIDLPAQAAAPQAEVSSLRLPARDQSEYIAASMAEKVAIRAGFSPTDAGKIKTSVLEGVLNAIEHSRNPEKLIDIQFRLSPEALEAWIENEGAPFVPGQDAFRPDPRAKLSAANKRGWGITLMRKFMDVASYEPCPGGTRLRLVKRRAAAPEAIESPSSAAIAAGAPSAPVAQEHSSLARHRKDKAQP